MKNKLFIFFVLSFFLIGKTYKIGDLEIKGRGNDAKYSYNGSYLNGDNTIEFSFESTKKWESLISDNKIDYKINKMGGVFKNGKIDGKISFYDKNDIILFEQNDEKGKYTYTRYYKDGIKIEEIAQNKGFFNNGSLIVGPYKIYHSNGTLKEEGTLDVCGTVYDNYQYSFSRKNGIVKRYYENGRLESELNFSCGLRHGKANFYGENQTLVNSVKYDSGFLDE